MHLPRPALAVLATVAMLTLVAARPPQGPRKNVLGGPLEICCKDPATGYHRDGLCRMVEEDPGAHVVCAVVTEAFLAFTRSRGNDLSTPHPELGFPGLKPKMRWCLCAGRWREAEAEGVAPPVVLEATDIAALEVVPLARLRAHAVGGRDARGDAP